MLSRQILNGIKSQVPNIICFRNIGVLAPVLQKASDPIQQLFIDKIREYKQKSGGGNKLIDPSPEIERELKTELEKVARQFGGDPSTDMTKFPALRFDEPVIDPISEPQKK